MTLFLMFVISFVPVFADTEVKTENTGDNAAADVTDEAEELRQLM